MKTVVYQSYRTANVPGWIEACMRSAREWALAGGFEYRFFDDGFLALAPDWYRERCGGEMCPVTDLARLVAARDLLREGFDRAVWLDADMLVFAPEALRPEAPMGFALCLEVGLVRGADGKLGCARTINNAMMVFDRGNAALDFLIDACLRIAMAKPKMHKLEIGSRMVTQLGRVVPFPLIDNVGLFTPPLMREIAGAQELGLPLLGAALPKPLAAANLCGSLAEHVTDEVYGSVVEACLRTRGGVVNRFVRTPAPPSQPPSASA